MEKWDTFLKIGLYHPLPCTLSLQFIIFLELAFIENYLTSDCHINTKSSLRSAYPEQFNTQKGCFGSMFRVFHLA